MADNIANFLPPSIIRLSPEPAQLELENGDHSLLLSTLQTAFPQGIGIYYRPKGSECRVMLKFDGRRFLPPDGGWNTGREYFVELGGAKQTAHKFPFGSYERASQQFERSVSLVQQMMNGLTPGTGTASRKGQRQSKSGGTALGNGPEKTVPGTKGTKCELFNEMDARNERNGVFDANGMATETVVGQQQKEGMAPANGNWVGKDGMDGTESPELTGRSIKQLERDFAILVSICTGKDMLVDGQRMELDRMRGELDSVRGEQSQWRDREAEWRAKLEAAEQELELLRELGKDQQERHGQIVELGRQLETERAEWQRSGAALEESARKWEREAQEWREKSEFAGWTANELTEQLKEAQRKRAELQRKTAILEEQVNGEAMEFSRRFQERERVQRELLQDNTRLYQIKEQLESEGRELKERLDGMEAEMERKLDAEKAQYESREAELCRELEVCRTKIIELERTAGELAGLKKKLEEQLDRRKNHSELGNSEPVFAYSQP